MMAIWLKACIEVLDMLWLVTFSDDCSQSVGGNINCGYKLRATLNFRSNVEALSLACNKYFIKLPKSCILIALIVIVWRCASAEAHCSSTSVKNI